MDWTEEGIAWLFLLRRSCAFSSTMVCFNCDVTDALLNATSTGVRAFLPALPRSKFTIDWTWVSVAIHLLHPGLFWWTLNASIGHLGKDYAFFGVPPTTTSGAASVEGLVGRHDAVDWTRLEIARNVTHEIWRAFFSTEERLLIDSPFFLVQAATTRNAAV
jgi:hypothetical protein